MSQSELVLLDSDGRRVGENHHACPSHSRNTHCARANSADRTLPKMSTARWAKGSPLKRAPAGRACKACTIYCGRRDWVSAAFR